MVGQEKAWQRSALSNLFISSCFSVVAVVVVVVLIIIIIIIISLITASG